MRGFFLLLILLGGCNGSLFEELGSHLAAPIAVAVDPANNRAYVVNSNLDVEFDAASVLALDVSTPSSPQIVSSSANPIPINNFSGQIYLDQANRRAFVANRLSENSSDKSDQLLQLDLNEAGSTFGQVQSFSVGENPYGVSCCDANGRGYLAQLGGSVVSFEPASPSTQSSLSLSVSLSSGLFNGKNSSEIAVRENQIFVTNPAGLIYVIRATDFGIDYVLTNAGAARGVAVDATTLYVVDATSSEPLLRFIPLSLVPLRDAGSAMTEIDLRDVNTGSTDIGADPNEVILFKQRAYVSNRGSDTVSVIDLATALTTIPVGDEPFGMAAFTGSDGVDYLYVTNLAGNSLSVVNLATNSVVATFSP